MKKIEKVLHEKGNAFLSHPDYWTETSALDYVKTMSTASKVHRNNPYEETHFEHSHISSR